MIDLDSLIERTDAIREKYEHYWRDEQAQAELKAIWGDAINANGVFVNAPEEILYDRDGYKAWITIGTANGLHAFGCGFQTPIEGYGNAPSIWDELFETRSEARTAAIRFLLERLPEAKHPHEHAQREQVERMRKAVANELRQPSLF
ncbi:hypothetical protein [Zavarzinella formosa]|uniref:hypothetical protein n=1 Tax=Zavarzinella formosa TaxID=360055 RepID=UPI00031D1D41|nr:hypothetical protein [Zavarzinella formosa]